MFSKKRKLEDNNENHLFAPSKKPLPFVGVRKRLLSVNPKNYQPATFSKALRNDYQLALLKASIKALECDVIDISHEQQNEFNLRCQEYSFVRDPVLILHDKKLVIYSKYNRYYGADDIVSLMRSKGYTPLLLDNCYFEGGNVFYVPSKKRIFHGLNPLGWYRHDPEIEEGKTEYIVPPLATNNQLNHILAPYDIHVSGLQLNKIVRNRSGVWNDYYYHLDCFMQILPDGRLIILNKNILSEKSQQKLMTLFGGAFCDLAYPGYLTKPFILNFIAIPQKNNFAIIAPTMPDSVRNSLCSLGLQVVTPETLDHRSTYYNAQFAELVAAKLKQDGFKDPKADNLTTHVPKNSRGYFFSNGQKGRWKQKNGVKHWPKSIDNDYSAKPISFETGGGGPHCLSLEIDPGSPGKPIVDNAHEISFFKSSISPTIKTQENESWLSTIMNCYI